MKPEPSKSASSADIQTAAAEWIMRHDRGLSPHEQDLYLQWLAANPAHAAMIARLRQIWDSFDRLAGLQSTVATLPDPDLLARGGEEWKNDRGARWWRRPHGRWMVGALAAGLTVAALGLISTLRTDPDSTTGQRTLAIRPELGLIEERTLPDGSLVRLNRGAVLSVDYSATRRGVRLVRGEAAFEVVKEPTRPFVVEAATVAVRAVGTAFNVRVDEHVVDVIVSKGIVAVSGERVAAPAVNAGQRVVVGRATSDGAATVSAPDPAALARLLAWQPRSLQFVDEPLPVILREFNRHNQTTLRAEGGTLQALRLSAHFRSDNLAAFIRLLESDFGVSADYRGNGEIILRSRSR